MTDQEKVTTEEIVPMGKALLIIGLAGLVLAFALLVFKGSLPGILDPSTREFPDQLMRDNLEMLLQQVTQAPDDPQVYVELGWAYYLAGKADQAAKAYRQALDFAPDHLPALLNMGILLVQERNYEEAADYFNKILRQNPGHELARFNLGVIAIKMGDLEKGIENLNHVIKANPTSGDAWYYLGKAQESKGQVKAALLAYRQALKFLPEHREAKEGLKRLGTKSEGSNE